MLREFGTDMGDIIKTFTEGGGVNPLAFAVIVSVVLISTAILFGVICLFEVISEAKRNGWELSEVIVPMGLSLAILIVLVVFIALFYQF